MLNWHLNPELNQQHHRDLLREADHERLVNQAQSANTRSSRTLYTVLLAQIGRQLIRIGQRLEDSSFSLHLETPSK